MPNGRNFITVAASSTATPRRAIAGLAAAVALAVLSGCTTSDSASNQPVDPMTVAMYAAVGGEPFPVPAIPVNRVDPNLFRQVVATPPEVPDQPGTVVIDPQQKYLYLVQAGGQSLRYAIGVGRQGFSWAGEAQIWEKREWPMWFPPAEMMARDPYAAKFPEGMEGGPKNPLGSRAMYLFQGKCKEGNVRTPACVDTLYRVHATNEPLSIGKAVSSGCIRMWNQDIIDLYNRVPIGTKVVVLGVPDVGLPDGAVPPGGPVMDGGVPAAAMAAPAPAAI